jgi:hypothetical protein
MLQARLHTNYPHNTSYRHAPSVQRENSLHPISHLKKRVLQSGIRGYGSFRNVCEETLSVELTCQLFGTGVTQLN